LEWLYQTVGDVRLGEFTLDHGMLAMSSLPKTARASATRRHYAQALHHLLALAVFPARTIATNPLPTGFMPKIVNRKAEVYLYPAEDALLLSCDAIPLADRLLYGFAHREGLRPLEMALLQWRDLDLVNGTITLDKNKTDDPRAWALTDGVKQALLAYRNLSGDPDAKQLVFAQVTPSGCRARLFRSHLKLAGITRPELFEENENRRPIWFRDTRATFVTVSLADGKTETWVADRIGHKSSNMINRYRRVSRTATELGLGTFEQLIEAIPELAAKKSRPRATGRATGQTARPAAIPKARRTDQRASQAPYPLDPKG
jgi:integrase